MVIEEEEEEADDEEEEEGNPQGESERARFLAALEAARVGATA